MTRREWVLTLSAGLCGGMVPACTRAVVDSASAAPPPPAQTAAAPKDVKTLSRADEPLPPPDVAPPVHLVEEPKEPGSVAQAAQRAHPDEGPQVQRASLNQAGGPGAEGPGAVQPAKAEDPPLVAALRCFLDKRPAEALTILERFDKANQELLLCLLPLSARLTEESLDRASPKQIAVVVDQLNTLAVPLRCRAELAIDKMCFCGRIETFGVYDPLPAEHRFRPGEWVHLYVEVRNFSSVRRDGGPGGPTYVTRLKTRVEIRDEQDRIVWRHDVHRDRPDESRTLRHDYFDHLRFCVPEVFRPGLYTLKVQVADEATGRTVVRKVDFPVSNLSARDF